MNQKEKIVSLLRVNGIMTQSELAEAMYGDKLHTTNIYSALMSLVDNKRIIRSGTHPARYSLREICNEACPLSTADMEVFQPKANHQAVTMSAERAVSLIQDYFNETQKDVHGRYLSWKYCYKAFSEKRNETNEQTIDYLALHLAFYLASWGMYRGSSFLLQKDYKIHIPIVRIIQEEKYNRLFGISAENLCQKSNLDLLEEIGARIKNSYANESPVSSGMPNNATDTLITKILLGTLGCVPAYDRYFVHSVKKHCVASGKYNRNSIYCIAKFYCDNSNEFEMIRQEFSKYGVDYPPMKLMDMCFWQDAYIEDLEHR